MTKQANDETTPQGSPAGRQATSRQGKAFGGMGTEALVGNRFVGSVDFLELQQPNNNSKRGRMASKKREGGEGW
jgi:hypothetical protein